MRRRISRREALRRTGAAGAGLVLARASFADETEIQIASVSPHTVRISVVPKGAVSALPTDGSLIRDDLGPVVGRAGSDPVRAGNLRVRFTPEPPSVHVETAGGEGVQRLVLDRESGAFSFRLGDAPLLGLGQGGPQFDRRGSQDTMRSGQGGYKLRTHGGRVPIQWLIGTNGWAMFIHQPLGSFDFTGTDGRFTPFPGGGALDVFVVGSKDPALVMAEYARLTGLPEMPPLWSLGYLQSHRTLAGPETVMNVARTFRDKKLPCDALIYLGTEFTPSGWNTRNGEFGWHKGNFPDPKRMLDELHEKHFKVVLHIVFEGRRMDGSVHDACVPEKAVPSGRTSDDKWPDDRNVACYWPYHKPLSDLGVDGWWPDQGDGLDAASRLRRIAMYWEGQQLWRPNERPFALHRNGHAGMARYGAFLWSGDVYTTWETLRTHVPVAVNTGLSGIPLWGTDIGGFVPTAEYTGELHVRWFQFGAFCPLFRAHGRTWNLRLPWGWNTGELGPDELSATSYRAGAQNPPPSELRNPDVEPICRKYLELRYRLLPYTYTVVREAHDTGMPVIRALWLHHSDDPLAVARGDQYLWGRDILVSPVVEKGARSRKLYLPRGTWFDFWTEERLAGGRDIERPVDLATMPLHVRAGAIVPMGPVKQYTDEPVDRSLALTVYPGADGAFTLYEDDGKTFGYRHGEFTRLAIAWRDKERRLTVKAVDGSRPLPRRTLEVRVVGTTRTRAVTYDGRAIDIVM